MYRWIWRQLPFGLPGKLIGSVLIVTSLVALLWYVIFPWAEPLLPFDDVQVTQDSGVPDDPAGGADSVDGDQQSGADDHDIPYDTDESASPTAIPSR